MWSETDQEPHTARDHEDLAGLHEHETEFRLDVEVAFLWADEHVAVGVAEGTVVHAGVEGVDGEADAFF